jgi:tRNA dimethylallyltransferase
MAQALNTEIISVDSAQVFRGMDVGTAKPTEEERGGIVHHLIDILDPAETFSTGQFRERTLRLMDDISGRGKIPLLTGGTMLYFNTLFHGLAKLPPANAEIRRKLDQDAAKYGREYMHRRLAAVDPKAAVRIHPNDPQRVQRALEVYDITGKPITQFFKEAQDNHIPFKKIKLIVAPEDRKQLHEKIAQRFKLMMDAGLVNEVKALYDRGDLTDDMPAIRAVGYRQGWCYLKGEYPLEMMIEKGIIATRQLAKRQFTWLRREHEAFTFTSSELDLSTKVLQRIRVEI